MGALIVTRTVAHSYAEEAKRIMDAVANKIMALATGESGGRVAPIRR